MCHGVSRAHVSNMYTCRSMCHGPEGSTRDWAECGACSAPPLLVQFTLQGFPPLMTLVSSPSLLDRPGLRQLHEQQQAWSSLWLPAPEPGCGEGRGEGSPGLGEGEGWWPVAYNRLLQLLEMKSTDRKQTLLHYLVKVIAEKYPQLTGFHSDLHFLDKAGSGTGGQYPYPWLGGAAQPWRWIRVGRKQDDHRVSLDRNAVSLIPCLSTAPSPSVPGQHPRGRARPAARPGVDPAGVCAAG